ncbi:MAG: Gfo/Idh/MocA family oxidoreductase [Christensenella sp.]|uniref:Gfo/Idh/MocA family protein n=1 Tax=Christensenella sp. TaxID=1935934 RepID=UPI002B20D83A|nr:Gfo/Idh/MocA family oxidoreductase [Christensenella sp.]MEA5002185.1 Gfo/Idh/MocA family oxidoreductase [Christensenella sp.]
MFRIVVVGTGFIGSSHIKAIGNIEDVTLDAIVEQNRERGEEAAVQAGCAWYPSFDELIKNGEKPDLAIIALPTFLHEEYVIRAAQAKINVLCEKPVTLSIDSFDRMSNACKENGVCFMVAQVVRWWPEFVEIKKLLDENKVGKLRMIYEARLAQHPGWSTWHTDPQKSGGGLFDLHIHDIDYLYSLFGMPESVYAVGWKSSTGCWNHIASNFKWKNGLKAVCEASMDMKGGHPFTIQLRVAGDDGTLDYRFVAGVNIKDGEQTADLIYYPEDQNAVKIPVEQFDPYEQEVRAYVQAIRKHMEAPIPAWQSRDVLRIVSGISQSLETGTVFTF